MFSLKVGHCCSCFFMASEQFLAISCKAAKNRFFQAQQATETQSTRQIVIKLYLLTCRFPPGAGTGVWVPEKMVPKNRVKI